MATLYLHIGTPKTGTSAIQYFMAKNRRILKRAGYCYPDFGIRFPGIGKNRNGHFLVRKIYDKEKNNLVDKESELVAECMGKVSRLVKKYPNIVLSDEAIWHHARKKKNFWENLKEGLNEKKINLKVVVFLRRQDLFVQSYWAQQVKETSTASFDEYLTVKLKHLMLDYYDCLNKIANVVGRENIIVEVYEKQNSAIPDFMKAINLKITDKYKNADVFNNTSLSGICLEVKRMLNNMPEYKEKNSFIVPLLKDIQTETTGVASFKKTQYFSYDKQLKFLKQYAKSNSAVAREFLNRNDGILFRESIKPNENAKIDSYSPEELIAVCGKIIARQRKLISLIRKGRKLIEIAGMLKAKGKMFLRMPRTRR